MRWFHALGKVEQFQTQEENYSLITYQPGSDNLTPKSETETRMATPLKMNDKRQYHRSHTFVRVCNLRRLLDPCRRRLWLFRDTALHSLIRLLDYEEHLIPPLLPCRM